MKGLLLSLAVAALAGCAAAPDFSRQRGLTPGMGVREFRRRMPVSGYDEYQPVIEQLKAGRTAALLGSGNPLLMFTLSSGTTADAKYIPITRRFLADYRRGWHVWGIRALDAHPAIGQRGGVSARSAAEQGADADPAVLAELDRLNRAYEERHGFRFVVFVDRRPKAEILQVLRERLDRPTEEELETALGELVAIAVDRWTRA